VNEAMIHKKHACLGLFILLLIFNIGDYILTILSINEGASEMNPIAQLFIDKFGLVHGILFIKLISILSGIVIYVIYVLGGYSNYIARKIHPNFAYRAMLLAAIIMGMVNIYQIYNYAAAFV